MKNKVRIKKNEGQSISGVANSDSDDEIDKLVGMGVKACV